VGKQYRITPEMKLQWREGSVNLTFFIGSRRLGRSYAYSYDGGLFQAPVGFYANKGAWDLAPGYEHDTKPDLNRPITPDCLFCHATRADVAAGSLNRYRTITHGIQCARCHGTSSNHGELVNPRNLSSPLRDSVCDQCHLAGAVRLVRAGKRLADFRSGENLADYVEVFVAGRKQGVRVNGHSEALALSKCKQKSAGQLWCGTCHNPHRAEVNYSNACRGCHTQPHSQDDCIGCHMPKAKAYDGGHTVFTDHSLSPKSAPRPLASYFRRVPTKRDLGLAYVQIGMEWRDSSYFEKAWPLLREAGDLKAVDPQLNATIGALLQADGRKEQAAAYYRLSLAQDPIQPDILNKLAGLVEESEAGRLRKSALMILPHQF
jgi:hypothetical protein